jgi:hypothetical protein
MSALVELPVLADEGDKVIVADIVAIDDGCGQISAGVVRTQGKTLR